MQFWLHFLLLLTFTFSSISQQNWSGGWTRDWDSVRHNSFYKIPSLLTIIHLLWDLPAPFSLSCFSSTSTFTCLTSGLIWRTGEAVRRKVPAVSPSASTWSSGSSSTCSWTLPTTSWWVLFASFKIDLCCHLGCNGFNKGHTRRRCIFYNRLLWWTFPSKERNDSDVQERLRRSLHQTCSDQLLTTSTWTPPSMTASLALTSHLQTTEFHLPLLMWPS